MLNFALIGVAGYVAPRHMQAISYTQNKLVAAVDPNDSVGIIDNYFPEANFFLKFDSFDQYLKKLRDTNHINQIDYVSICSPNYLHYRHICSSLYAGANAICEKPLVLDPWDLDRLHDVEQVTGKKINTILQLRVHPAILALKKKLNLKNYPENMKLILHI